MAFASKRAASRRASRLAARRKSPVKRKTVNTVKKNSSSKTKPTFKLADLKAFNKLPDKVRRNSKKKLAAFKAAGFGVFEDSSVNTQGKGFKRFVTGSKGLK